VRRYVLLGAAVVVAMLFSRELSLSLPILGIGPDLAVLVVAGFAMGERPRVAATAGFSVGLLRDLLLTTPRGLSALSYAVVGYLVAQLPVPRGVGQVVGVFAGCTLLSQALYGLGAVFLSGPVDASPVPRMLLITTVYNVLLSPLLLPLLNRVVKVDGRSRVGSEIT
jgi:rod shape-determining protein MreD